MTNFVDADKLAHHEVIAYLGLEGELVVAVQRHGTLVIRIIVAPQGTPQVMVVAPPAGQRR